MASPILGQTGMPDRKVWGHKMAEHSIHLTNEGPLPNGPGDYADRNYFTVPSGPLNTAGVNVIAGTGSEATTHAPWGGALRDRHRRIPGMPTANSDYQQYVEDEDVRRAKAHGLQGFTSLWTNFTTTDQKTIRARKSIIACTKVDNFKTIVTPDMTLTAGTLTAQAFANALLDLMTISGTYGTGMFKLDDGKFVIAPYLSGTVNHSSWKTSAWWSEMFGYLETAGKPTVMVMMPNGLNDSLYNFFDAIPQCVGYNAFGPTTPDRVSSYATIGTTMRARPGNANNIYMAPISFGDSRVAWGQYWEQEGYKLLQDSAQQVVTNRNGATAANLDWVQLKTWSDYTEACAFADSEMSIDNSYMRMLNRWFLPKWRTGSDPVLTTDSVQLAHRTHKMAEPIKLAAPLALNTAYTSISVPTTGVGSVTNTLHALLVPNAKLTFWTGASVTIAVQPNVGAATIQIQSYTPQYLGKSADGKLLTGSAYDQSNLGAAGWIAGEVLQVLNVGATQQVRPQVNGKYLRQDLGNGNDTVNIVDCVTMLTAAADVTVTVGGVAQTPYTAPAGYYRQSFPLAVGAAPSVVVSRSGVTQVTATSPSAVFATPWVIDPHYISTYAENPPVTIGDPEEVAPQLNRIQIAYGTAAEWASQNPTLRAGESGLETDTGREKVGLGLWNSLPYKDEKILARYVISATPAPLSGEWIRPSNMTGNGAVGSPTSGDLYFTYRDIGANAVTINALNIYCSTAQIVGTSTLVTRLGIYADDGTGRRPLLTGGPLAQVTVTPNANSTNFSGAVSLTLNPLRRYWYAFLYTATGGSGATAPVLTCMNGAISFPGTDVGTRTQALRATGQTAFPTSAVTLSVNSGTTCPIIAATVV